MSNLFVVCLGVATVFVGLICIIILTKLMSLLLKDRKGESPVTPVTAPAAAAPEKIENRQEIIAAVSAVVAEELGTDISAIRILSFKKL